MITMAQNASQIIPCSEPTIARPGVALRDLPEVEEQAGSCRSRRAPRPRALAPCAPARWSCRRRSRSRLQARGDPDGPRRSARKLTGREAAGLRASPHGDRARGPRAGQGLPAGAGRRRRRPGRARGRTGRLLGPNGAGKTTTLLMLLGVVAPDEGTVVICGRRLERQRSRAAENVGFAAGYLPLAERLRVREYLRLYGNLYGLTRTRPGDRSRARAVPGRAPRRRDGHRALVGPAHARRDRAGHAAPAPPARARRADRVARPRRRAAGPHRPRAALRGGRDRAARDEPRHGRGLAALRAGHLPLAGSRRRRRHARRGHQRFGRSDLEGVFLHLAEERLPEHEPPGTQQTDHACRATERPSDRLDRSAPRRRAHVAAHARVARRHAYVLARSPHRLFDVTLWPLVDVLLFGALATYVSSGQHLGGGARRELPARRHRALARRVPVADRGEHRVPRGDVVAQPAQPHGDADARGRVRRRRRAVRHAQARHRGGRAGASARWSSTRSTCGRWASASSRSPRCCSWSGGASRCS